jgi:ElaB/YqjD/DUF883 family membrane-anchored ribosome-binding protein
MAMWDAMWTILPGWLNQQACRSSGNYPFPTTATRCVSAHTTEDFCHSLPPRSKSAQLSCAAFGSAELFDFLLFTQENTMDATTRTSNPLPIVNHAADAALNKAAASVHGAVDKMAGAADDAVRNVKPAIDRVANIAHQAVNKVTDVAGPTAEWLSAQGSSLKATGRKVTADTGQYVSAHPWKSLGFALAAGLVISRFIR